MEKWSRLTNLIGEDAIDALTHAHVAVFGVGGVGGYAVEALARSGIGELTLVDADDVAISNINRQIIATDSTIGRAKVDVAAERVHDINPDCKVHTVKEFFLPESSDAFDFAQYDYVIDAIDTVSAKIELVVQCDKTGTPIIASMGAGNKTDATAFRVADIYDTSVCPLAKVMRKELKARGIKSLQCVYSTEQPHNAQGTDNIGRIPASCAWVPPAVGLILAGEVIKAIAKI